jgi:hypothetical protein
MHQSSTLKIVCKLQVTNPQEIFVVSDGMADVVDVVYVNIVT